jgi:hypothetical protein
MSTIKHRIAAYLPPDVDEKFQVFKQQRGVGDSQALILILTEFLEVSHGVNHSNSLDVKSLKSELLGELLGELDFRFGELKSELLSKSLDLVETTHESLKNVNVSHDSLIDVKVTHEGLKAVELGSEFVERPTIAQLSTRFGSDSALTRKQKSKYKDEPEKFIAWSKSRDPDGYGWKFDEVDRVFDRVFKN